MKRICPKCNQEKPLGDFYKNAGKCKSCQHEYNKVHNKENKIKYSKYQKKSNRMVYYRGQDFINRYKKICGCKKCREKRYWVLDCHHINSKDKVNPITYYKSCTIKTIKYELRKCIILCRNCHSDFHFLEKTQNITLENYF